MFFFCKYTFYAFLCFSEWFFCVAFLSLFLRFWYVNHQYGMIISKEIGFFPTFCQERSLLTGKMFAFNRWSGLMVFYLFLPFRSLRLRDLRFAMKGKLTKALKHVPIHQFNGFVFFFSVLCFFMLRWNCWLLFSIWWCNDLENKYKISKEITLKTNNNNAVRMHFTQNITEIIWKSYLLLYLF